MQPTPMGETLNSVVPNWRYSIAFPPWLKRLRALFVRNDKLELSQMPWPSQILYATALPLTRLSVSIYSPIHLRLGGTTMIVLSPEGKAQSSGTRVAALPRFTELNGKVVGLLDNSKPNADKLEERFAQLLRERLDVAKVVTRRKISAQQGAPKEYLDELAAQADFILSGLGD